MINKLDHKTTGLVLNEDLTEESSRGAARQSASTKKEQATSPSASAMKLI